jgi:hypothetical protein
MMGLGGASRGVFYDPGFPAQNRDDLWNYGGGIRVTGYAYTFPDPQDLHSQAGIDFCATNIVKTFIPQPINYFNMTFPAPSPSERPLLACANIAVPVGAMAAGGTDNATGVTDPSQAWKLRWINICGGVDGGRPFHRSPHLNAAQIPDGGNIGMLDGRVIWRKFPQFFPRSDPKGGKNGTSPQYWW